MPFNICQALRIAQLSNSHALLNPVYDCLTRALSLPCMTALPACLPACLSVVNSLHCLLLSLLPRQSSCLATMHPA